MRFFKYHGLGNDYAVVELGTLELSGVVVRRICDRHFGLGSDGLLVEAPGVTGAFGLRILNPDGSEAEKSGNGLRIFARYLYDTGRVSDQPFTVSTLGGDVGCEVRDSGRTVFVEMGTASFESALIPVAGPSRAVIGETLYVAGRPVVFTAVTVGNPHCVVHVDDPTRELALELGPLIESHPLFPNRTNVQFVGVIDSHTIRSEIWERGAGYTLASGSSSCAAAAASVRLGLCEGDVRVMMPGGHLEIGVSPEFDLTMLGPVEAVATGVLSAELLSHAAG